VSVTVQSGCVWAAAPTVTWIRITAGDSGKGPGTVEYVVARFNGNGTRAGSIVIGGVTFTITQRGDKDDDD
jgi:hypothetical protein